MRKNRKLNNGGYTLVELVVVITIILVLTGGLALGGAKLMRQNNFDQQNEYAKLIFSAAQNRLGEYAENGRLEDFQSAVSGAELLSDGGRVQMTPTPIGIDNLPLETGEETCVSVILTPADYQSYAQGNADAKTAAVYDLFADSLYDPSILNAAVCLELCPEEGTVYSVFFCGSAEGLTYADTDTDTVFSIHDRTAAARKENLIGWYGVENTQ